MIDEYNAKRYIPKKHWAEIEQIDRELDFDNTKNRNVNFYIVWMKNGDRVSGTGITELREKVNLYFCNQQK